MANEAPKATIPNDPAKKGSHRFQKGNPGGPGNPYIKAITALRQALYEAIDREEMLAIIKAIANKAKKGNVGAATFLVDRLLGAPVAADIHERIAELERMIEEQRKTIESRTAVVSVPAIPSMPIPGPAESIADGASVVDPTAQPSISDLSTTTGAQA